MCEFLNFAKTLQSWLSVMGFRKNPLHFSIELQLVFDLLHFLVDDERMI